ATTSCGGAAGPNSAYPTPSTPRATSTTTAMRRARCGCSDPGTEEGLEPGRGAGRLTGPGGTGGGLDECSEGSIVRASGTAGDVIYPLHARAGWPDAERQPPGPAQ